jgi:glycosyltransferase involved in cell wall biosynthesis
MFSLCIPTMGRYDAFLSKHVPRYLDNDLIAEVIVVDETGEDAAKLRAQFPNESKLHIHTNESRLGPFLNKLKACRLATSEWIVLIDSDNFADKNYFEVARDYISNHPLSSNTILAPCWAAPRFDYRFFAGKIFSRETFWDIREKEHQGRPQFGSEVLMNTGNYILRKHLVQSLNIEKEQENIPKSSACDVIYMNTLFFEQLDARLHVVPNMIYEHVVHDGSIYIQTHQQWRQFNDEVHNRYRRLCVKPRFRFTLREWQTRVKDRGELLYNCSEFDRLNDEWVPFSIGMGWSIINFQGTMEEVQLGKHEQIALCAIKTHTDQRRRGTQPVNRQTIVNTLARNGISNISFESADYFRILPSFQFVISPEGNGIDCHRHYEALMAGCIPIVEEHTGIREKYAGCPVLYTRDYSEITLEYLSSVYKQMLDTEYDFSKLMLSHYMPNVQAEIKQNGNYWATRLTGRPWY